MSWPVALMLRRDIGEEAYWESRFKAAGLWKFPSVDVIKNISDSPVCGPCKSSPSRQSNSKTRDTYSIRLLTVPTCNVSQMEPSCKIDSKLSHCFFENLERHKCMLARTLRSRGTLIRQALGSLCCKAPNPVTPFEHS